LDEKEALDRLQFLYERRAIQFNTRRDYEWKILFGVIGLLTALDAGQVGYGIQLIGWQKYVWVCVVVALAAAYFCSNGACSDATFVIAKR